MLAANYTEFRTDLKKFLDNVEENNEILIIKRNSGKGTVLISLEEYNSITRCAPLHLNADHRAKGRDAGSNPRGHRAASVWLRYLPGSVPLEPARSSHGRARFPAAACAPGPGRDGCADARVIR